MLFAQDAWRNTLAALRQSLTPHRNMVSSGSAASTMSIRITALYLVVAGLSIYAWKDWFKSLCGLILLMAILEHEDMPTSIFGIQGLNPWNVLFLMIFLAWMASRRRNGLVWDMPRHVNVLLLLYLGVIIVGFLRSVIDRRYLDGYPLGNFISEELINSIKWAVPALLLFDGCRTRRQLTMALVCILILYFLLAVRVAKFMPPVAAFGDGALLNRLRPRLGRYMGYSAPDISAMLAGASWGIMAGLSLIRKRKYQLLCLFGAAVVAYGQALTGGRAGFAAWALTGLVLGILKWRKYLLLTPLVVVVLPVVFPAATARMLSGFGQQNPSGETVIDDYTVTSGRTEAWPRVIQRISRSPIIGYGRLGMQRTGLTHELANEDLQFAHPHNVYLETLLDNGLLGSLPIVLYWGTLVIYAAFLFRSTNRLYSAVGGLALALILAQVFAGIGAQHYYPRISTLGMWASAMLMLRVRVEEKRLQISVGANLYVDEEKAVATPAFSVASTCP